MRFPCLPLLAVAAATAADAALSEAVRGYWFSGAEISRFELTQSRYGSEHPGHAELVFVTEPFLVDRQVKHEAGPGESVPVLKLNALRTFNTGIYAYRTMTSTFQPLDLDAFPHALKSNTTVQDWCGQVFQQFNRRSAGWAFQLRSYFQGEGDLDDDLEDGWIEDEIWTRLRLDPSTLPTGDFTMVPGALFNRFRHLETQAAAANGSLRPAKGKSGDRSTYMLRYPDLGRTLEITFDTAFPHVIRGWVERFDGSDAETRAVLTHRIEQSEYWSQNGPGDRPLRKRLGLAPVPD